MNDVYLLLGSNIEPEKHVKLALQSLHDSELLEVVNISSIWQTKAVGASAPDFLNVAVNIQTTCELHCLKEIVLGEIEENLGRVRTVDKNAPRTIDLDVIVFNNQIVDKEVFIQDHVMLPMAELLPDLYSEDHGCTLLKLSADRLKQTLAKKIL